MRMIDAHVHLLDEPGYLDLLLAEAEACGMERICLSGLGEMFGCAGNRDVKEALSKYPERITGAVFVRPGVDGPEVIDRAHDDGFRMVKVTIPRVPYDNESCFPLWERAVRHGMPVLFHTGVVTTAREVPGERISSWHMHPMRIEPITREFPELGVIVAHLGTHWNEDAAELARMRPNVYVDLTGEPDGWRQRADRVGMDTWLWWPGAFDKVVFGTDVHRSKIKLILEQDVARLDRLGVDAETRRRIFSGNILHLLGQENPT